MNAIALECSTRDGRGKGPARQLRAAGRVPAVIYGHGVESPVAVSVDPKALDLALANPKKANALMNAVVADGPTHTVMVREIQRHPVSRKILHVDLVAPDLEREIVASVPLKFVGKAVGVVTGGRLRTPYREIKLRARPANFPAEVEADLTPLDHGDALHVSTLGLPEGVEAVYDRDYVVAKVLKPRGGAKAADAES